MTRVKRKAAGAISSDSLNFCSAGIKVFREFGGNCCDFGVRQIVLPEPDVFDGHVWVEVFAFVEMVSGV